MALLIDFTLTEAGIAAAFNAQSTGIDVELTHVAFGIGFKNPNGLETALVNEVKREPISGGSRVRPSQIRVAAVWAAQNDVADILEIGIYAGSVLFAYASSSAGTVIAKKVVGVDFVFYYDWVLSGIPADTISILIDPNAAVALAALQIHIQDPLAHEQYLHRADFAQDGAPFTWAGIAGGTPDSIELTLDAESVLTSYRAGQKFVFLAQDGNTGPVSLSVNGLTEHSVRKDGTDALAEGDIFGGKVYEVTFDGLNFQIAGVTDFYNKLQTYSRSEVNSLLGNKVNTIDMAAQADAEAGTDNAKWMTPLRVFQAIAAKVQQATEAAFGWLKIATQAQVIAAADDNTTVTPLKLNQRLLVGSPVIGSIRKGSMSVSAPSATATFTADEVIVATALGGKSYRISALSKSINLAATGAGGMDTGSAPASGFVSIYGIYNPVTAATALLACNQTVSSGSVYSGANMPAGYTASALLGVWPTNSSSQFPIGYQLDRTVYINVSLVINSSSQVPTPAALSLSGAVPPNARSVAGIATISASVTANINFTIASATGGNLAQQNIAMSPGLSISGNFEVPLITPQTVYYAAVTTAGAISFLMYISSYTF